MAGLQTTGKRRVEELVARAWLTGIEGISKKCGLMLSSVGSGGVGEW